jgi:surface protein
MSINVASQTGITNGRRNTPPVYNYPVTTQTLTPYVRPSDWLTMTTVLNTEQKIVLLYAVFNDESNILGIICTTSSGNFNIDWGDGTSSFSGASNTTASHKFDWNNVSAATLTTRGYRQVLITITPASGNLTGFSLNTKYVDTTTTIPNYICRILESIVSGPFLTSINHGSNAQVPGLMEQAQILSTGTNCNLTNCYINAYNLQSIVGISANTGTIINATSMFLNCYRLQALPLFNTSLVTTTSSMFGQCYNLISVPSFVLTSCTTLSSMFINCFNLINAPQLSINTTTATTMSAMFSGCTSLTNVPLYNTVNINNMSQMFQNCYSLKTCPNFNTIKVTSMASMFSACWALQTVPLFNYIVCTNTSVMFNGCYSLRTVPPLNLPVVTNINQMFNSCWNVVSIGTITTSTALTNIAQAFVQCRSLINLPLITNTINCTSLYQLVWTANSLVNVANLALYNTSNVTNCQGTFGLCSSLQTVPVFTTTKVTDMYQMFYSAGIINAPSLDTGNVQTMEQMFYFASSLTTIPAYNTSKVTNMSVMLQSTPALATVPAFDTSNVTNFTTFLYQSGARSFDANLNTSKGTTFTNFVSLNYNLQSIPAFNMANATSIGAAFNNNQNLGNFNATNIKITTSFASSLLGVNALQGIFANSILSNNTTQTITITGNPGATTALTKTVAWTNTSNVMTMANTVNVIVGAQVSNTANVNLGYVGTLASNKVSVASVIDDNTIVSFTTVTTSNALANTLYYTSNRSGAGPYMYDISTTQGGTPNTFTNGTANMRVNLLVTAVNTNANVILSAYPAGNGTATTVTTRTLNTNLAAYKGWTVTG